MLRDQFLFMHRCGFDAFEVADATAVEAWRKALAEFTVFYQPAADGRVPAQLPRAACGGRRNELRRSTVPADWKTAPA